MAFKEDGTTVAGVDWPTGGVKYKFLNVQDITLNPSVLNENLGLEGNIICRAKFRIMTLGRPISHSGIERVVDLAGTSLVGTGVAMDCHDADVSPETSICRIHGSSRWATGSYLYGLKGTCLLYTSPSPRD